MPSREHTIDQIVECSRAAFRAMHSAATPEWLDLDLTMAQLKALLVLSEEEPMTVGALGQCLRIHLPAASHAVDRLVQLDLAQRCEDPEDRRRTFVRLTPCARALVERLHQGKLERIRGYLADLADDDLAALHRGLQAIAALVGRHQSSPLSQGTHCRATTPDEQKLEEQPRWHRARTT